MAHVAKVIPNFYRDSVALMQLSSRLSALPGVRQASAVMTSKNNLVLLREAGLLAGDVAAGPNDLLVALDAARTRRRLLPRSQRPSGRSNDAATKAIVLISKPPAPEIAARVLAQARLAGKPVVVNFLGADPNAGIAHREPGIGQIGAGITHSPLACFAEAVTALASSLPDQ
jgi:hypothetical protein